MPGQIAQKAATPAMVSPINSTLQPGQPIQIWTGNSGTSPYLFNNDIANTMYVGAKADVLRQDITSCIPIYPLGGQEWPDDEIWGFVPEGCRNLNYLIIPGATSFTPSPVQVQLALNAAGLATAALQQTQQNTLISGIGLPTGAAKDATVGNVFTAVGSTNTILGSPAQDGTVSGLNTGIPNGIAATGVPLLTSSALVKNVVAASHVAGGSVVYGPFTVGQIGYEIFLELYGNTNSTCTFNVLIDWFDSGTGIQTGEESWWITPGSGSGNPHTIFGSGPTKGDQVQITVTNAATSLTAVFCAFTFIQNSRVYAMDKWRTLNFSVAGLTGTATDTTSDVIASTNASVNAGAGITRVLPLYNGLVRLTFSTNSGTTDGDINIINNADSSQSGGNPLPNQTVYHNKPNAVGLLVDELTLPKGQCAAILTNNNAAAKVFGLSLIVEQILAA